MSRAFFDRLVLWPKLGQDVGCINFSPKAIGSRRGVAVCSYEGAPPASDSRYAVDVHWTGRPFIEASVRLS